MQLTTRCPYKLREGNNLPCDQNTNSALFAAIVRSTHYFDKTNHFESCLQYEKITINKWDKLIGGTTVTRKDIHNSWYYIPHSNELFSDEFLFFKRVKDLLGFEDRRFIRNLEIRTGFRTRIDWNVFLQLEPGKLSDNGIYKPPRASKQDWFYYLIFPAIERYRLGRSDSINLKDLDKWCAWDIYTKDNIDLYNLSFFKELRAEAYDQFEMLSWKSGYRNTLRLAEIFKELASGYYLNTIIEYINTFDRKFIIDPEYMMWIPKERPKSPISYARAISWIYNEII